MGITRRNGRAALALLLLLAAAAPVAALESNCSDGLDDDADSLVDCADPDCIGVAACEVSTTRQLAIVRSNPSDNATKWLNIDMLGWPDVPNLADLGNGGSPTQAKGCVGFDAGVLVGDGRIDSLDALCALHPPTSLERWGLVLSRFDTELCYFQGASASRGQWGPNYGTISFPITPGESYYLTVSSSSTVAPPWTVTLRGWNDPAWSGAPIRVPASGCAPQALILHLPYDMLPVDSDEVLCGLRGIDWTDADGDGDPDTCPAGIFDGNTPISVIVFDMTPGPAPTGSSVTDNRAASRAVLRTDLGLVFLGPSFPLRPGDALWVTIRDGQQPTLFRPGRR